MNIITIFTSLIIIHLSYYAIFKNIYDDIEILNMSIKYIFSNYLLDYNSVKNIFNKVLDSQVFCA